METIAEIKNDSRIGKLLRATSDSEEAAVEVWQSGLENRIKKALRDAKENWDLFGRLRFSQDYSDFSEVESHSDEVRKRSKFSCLSKGDLGRPIESWTADPRRRYRSRAQVAPDHAMTLSEMHKRV